MNTKSKSSRITHRVVNSKRHTQAYIIDGKVTSRTEAVRMAKAGRLHNIQAVGNHIQTLPARKQKLLDLPTKLVP